MRALVKHEYGAGNMEIRDVPAPAIADDEVFVEVKCVGVCVTDPEVYDDRFVNFPPIIAGHEFGGEIIEIGSATTTKGTLLCSVPFFVQFSICVDTV